MINLDHREFLMRGRLVARILLTLILSFFSLNGSAEEWVSGDAGISFRIPDDPSWGKATPPIPQIKLFLQRTDKTASVFFEVMPAPPDQRALNQDFVTGFEKGYWPQGKSVKRTGEFSTFKGKKIYKTSGEMPVKDILFKKAAIVWIENNEVYLICIMKRDADPFEDAVIKSFLENTKFVAKSTK